MIADCIGKNFILKLRCSQRCSKDGIENGREGCGCQFNQHEVRYYMWFISDALLIRRPLRELHDQVTSWQTDCRATRIPSHLSQDDGETRLGRRLVKFMQRRVQATGVKFGEDLLNEGGIQLINDIPGMTFSSPPKPSVQCSEQTGCPSWKKRTLDMNSSQRVMKERCRNSGLEAGCDKQTLLTIIRREDRNLET